MKKLLGVIIICFTFTPWAVAQAGLVDRLLGKILLQVEANGEAWYVNPTDSKRYFLGRPADAFDIMRRLGLGVSNNDFAKFGNYAPASLAGKILLKVEDLGQAYYVDPETLQMYYLGRPADAFDVMRRLGLGITNSNLANITAEFNIATKPNQTINNSTADNSFDNPNATDNQTNSQADIEHQFTWLYKGQEYQIDLDLSSDLYQTYATSPKSFYYTGKLPDDWRNQYYEMFLTPKSVDNSVAIILNQLKKIAAKDNLTNDQLVELTLSFVQTIPYDQNKDLEEGQLNYPYELLYRQLGVCSEKTFLAVMLIRGLGYGAAILDYDEVNHAAVGIACPAEYDVYDSGYCYAETTNIFPIGVTPQTIGDTVATNTDLADFQGQFDSIFSVDHLGQVEIFQTTTGKVYHGIEDTHLRIEKIKLLEQTIVNDKVILAGLKSELDNKLSAVEVISDKMDIYQASQDYDSYNALIPDYNVAVKEYNYTLNNYKMKVDLYNSNINDYNNFINDFYQ